MAAENTKQSVPHCRNALKITCVKQVGAGYTVSRSLLPNSAQPREVCKPAA